MMLTTTEKNSYSSQSDLKAMRAVGNDRHPHIVHFYAPLIDLSEHELVICMEVLETSMDKFYPILHSLYPSIPNLLDLFVRRLTKHVCLFSYFIISKQK